MGTEISQLKKLYAKTRTFKIPLRPKEGEEQIEIEMRPLTIDDFHLLDINESDSDMVKAKKTIPALAASMGVTEQEIAHLPMKYMADLSECLKEMNELDSLLGPDGERKRKSIEKLKERLKQ